MNKYKLGNIIKRDFLKRFKDDEISKHRFSFAYLNSLFKKYKVSEYSIHHYCCYGEDVNCWVDVDSAWMDNGHISDEELNRRIYRDFKHIAKFFNAKALSKRKVFVGENDDYIFYCFPMRDAEKQDVYIIFDKKVHIKQ